MLRVSVFLSLAILAASCSLFTSTLDKPFNKQTYRLYLERMLNKEEITQEEMFLINYAVVRQRDYYNYQIEGKTYREILAMARDFQQNGLPVKSSFTWNGQRDFLKATALEAEGAGYIREKEKSSILYKVLDFYATLQNTTSEDIALLNVTFLIFGPFKDHLATVGYEINCLLPAGLDQRFNFVADGLNIRNNALFNGDPELSNLIVDQLFSYVEVRIGGYTLTTRTRHFKQCILNQARFEPKESLDYAEAFTSTSWIERGPDGNAVELHLGNAHFEDETTKDLVTLPKR